MTRDPKALWSPSPHYTAGRNGYHPNYLILHGTAGGGAVQWFQNPESNVSAHYVIEQDGTVYQCVDEDDWAWANGPISKGHDPWWTPAVNPNWITISIEHSKPDKANATPLTPVQ